MGLLTVQPHTKGRLTHQDRAVLPPRCAGAAYFLQKSGHQRSRTLIVSQRASRFDAHTVFSSSKGPSSLEDDVDLTSNGGNGSDPPLNNPGNGGGGGENNDDSEDEDNFDLLNLAEAESMAAKNGIELPADFVAAAQDTGLRLSSLQKLIDLRGVFMVGFLMHSVPWVRDRLIADPRFLFKILAEVSIDSGCCTLAEIRKRGHDFWGEFEFYLSDMVVGIVLDVALVSLLAPVAVTGKYPKYLQQSGIKKWLGQLPSAVFEASIPGVKEYSLLDRLICYFVKGIEYSCVGFACGFVGQGFANGCMMLRRAGNPANDTDVPIPPLLKSALVWALFMGVSSNTRYQVVVGLERMVDLTLAKKIPQVAYGTTILIRFLNNVIGGENFIDMARWAGVQ